MTQSFARYFFALLTLVSSAQALEAADPTFGMRESLDRLMALHGQRAVRIMLENISPPDTLPGTIIASPLRGDASKGEANYFRHWIRDGALVVNVIVSLWENAAAGAEKEAYEKLLWDYVKLSRHHQQHMTEPLFNPDGTRIAERWGSPQPDGPALRAITMLRYSNILAEKGGTRPPDLEALILEDIRELFKGDYGYDIWEELRGHHFYTRKVHHRALRMALPFLEARGEAELQAKSVALIAKLKESLKRHWEPNLGFILATDKKALEAEKKRYSDAGEQWDGGIYHKTLHLDAQVILGVLHGRTDDGFFGVLDPRVIATVVKLEETFKILYPINHNGKPALAIGRYPEDNWDGTYRGHEGNPWIITTEAFGEYHDRVAKEILKRGYIRISSLNRPFFDRFLSGCKVGEVISSSNEATRLQFTHLVKSLRDRADAYYERVLYHLGDSGEFHEQINRHTGFLQGPHRLTWSCAAMVVGGLVRAYRIPLVAP